MLDDAKYMNQARDIAKYNPDGNIAVGCVIVKSGTVISNGFRKTFLISESPYIDITIHAEHMALLKAGNKSEGATLYTTLEPCTLRCGSPGDINICCCDLIIEYGIKRVVISEIDNNFGRGGIKKLNDAGIKTTIL